MQGDIEAVALSDPRRMHTARAHYCCI